MTKRKSLTQAASRLSLHQTARLDHDTPPESGPRRTLPIELAAIDPGKRLRTALDESALSQLAESMAALGLQAPVVVKPAPEAGRFLLLAGAHRLEAAARLGWGRIEAMVVDADADESAMIEIDENLSRAELSALDRALFIAARKALHERLNPAARHGGDRKTGKYRETTPDQVLNINTRSFTAKTAKRAGVSESMVRRAAMIGKHLTPALVHALTGTPLAEREGDLYRLSRLPAPVQRKIAKQLRQCSSPPRTLNALLPAPARETAVHSALERAWERAPSDERRRFLEALSVQGAAELGFHVSNKP